MVSIINSIIFSEIYQREDYIDPWFFIEHNKDSLIINSKDKRHTIGYCPAISGNIKKSDISMDDRIKVNNENIKKRRYTVMENDYKSYNNSKSSKKFEVNQVNKLNNFQSKPKTRKLTHSKLKTYTENMTGNNTSSKGIITATSVSKINDANTDLNKKGVGILKNNDSNCFDNNINGNTYGNIKEIKGICVEKHSKKVKVINTSTNMSNNNSNTNNLNNSSNNYDSTSKSRNLRFDQIPSNKSYKRIKSVDSKKLSQKNTPSPASTNTNFNNNTINDAELNKAYSRAKSVKQPNITYCPRIYSAQILKKVSIYYLE